jgi:DNA-binding NarL/FixJ family response regulator
MIRVFIADDHEFIRAGLKSILAGIADIEVIGEAASGHEVLQALREKTLDALILDMSMPGLSGLELIKRIKTEWPKQKILVLTMHTNKQYAVRAIRAGATGFVSKASASEELVAALRKIMSGRPYISTEIAEELALSQQPNNDAARHTALSDREYHVFELLVSGKSVGDIAGSLNLSVKTVSTHKARILEKMAMTSTAELVRYAVAHELSVGTDLAPE